MTTREQAFEVCLNFLKNSVIRGESEHQLLMSMRGSYGDAAHVHIGGHTWTGKGRWEPGKRLTKLKAGEMVVESIGKTQCCEVFKVSDIIKEVEDRWIPTVALLRRKSRG